MMLQRYYQVNENFFKSDHPAVMRRRPAQPDANYADAPELVGSGEEMTPAGSDTFSEYIVPIPDINAKAACELDDTASLSTSR